MRVLLTGGGTAGHINPALAIAQTIKQNDPSAVIEFVGVKQGKESDLVPREGYKLHFVESMGIRRSLSPANIKALWMAFYSPYAKQTVSIIKNFKPDVVIGTGGYACWPIMAAAARLGIPTALHESNALPGLAVRRLQKKVDRIWINFESTRTLLNSMDKVVHVGNPLRTGFGILKREDARRKLGIDEEQHLVLSFGGSLGANAVNDAMLAPMARCTEDEKRIHVHASGKRDYARMKSLLAARMPSPCDRCILTDYIYDMPTYMAAADVVIGRAGAMTVSELAMMHKAAILIPSPNVADDHQYKNAKVLADADAATLVREADFESGALDTAIEELLRDDALRARRMSNIAAFARTDSNRLIWEEIRTLLKDAETRKEGCKE